MIKLTRQRYHSNRSHLRCTWESKDTRVSFSQVFIWTEMQKKDGRNKLCYSPCCGSFYRQNNQERKQQHRQTSLDWLLFMKDNKIEDPEDLFEEFQVRQDFSRFTGFLFGPCFTSKVNCQADETVNPREEVELEALNYTSKPYFHANEEVCPQEEAEIVTLNFTSKHCCHTIENVHPQKEAEIECLKQLLQESEAKVTLLHEMVSGLEVKLDVAERDK